MVDWTPYLESLCNTYTQWWTFGTLKDVVEPKRFEFGLIVETVERDTQQRGKQEQKVERLSVLEGLQKYAPNHVLLVGRPGSGKSTALVRLLVATAQQALQNPHSQIPVLVELRTYNIYYKTSVLDLVQASLKRRKLRLNLETIEELLAEGRFLLLMDGINELPDDEARRNIKEFRLDYSDVPMVFTTRDLGVGGDLGIERKLEMQSPKEAEVEKFVRECMPGGSQQTLQQLRQRLRELGQTPFVMWMLYFIVQKTGTVPSGAGSAFREFTQLYERRSKDDAPVSDESRRWWSQLLEHLGFEMMQAQKPTDFRLTISKREAEDILTKVLDREKFDKPRDYALRWLEDLLKHHLIQVTSNDQIEFCHQLIQEYYAAESLLKVLTSSGRTSPPAPLLQGEGSKSVPPFPRREGGLGGLGLSDDELKRDYLNYLKWTEPLALMLELVEDEAQAVRVVKLALEVDLQLGARLAGAVKPEWQEKTVGLVVEKELPPLLKNELLGVTRSEFAFTSLQQGLNHKDTEVRASAVSALAQINSEKVISELLKLLKDSNPDIYISAAQGLGYWSCEAAIPGLRQKLADIDFRKRQSYSEKDFLIWMRLVYALGQLSRQEAIRELRDKIRISGFVLCGAGTLLRQLDGAEVLPELFEALEDTSTISVHRRGLAAIVLGQLGNEIAIPRLLKALEDADSSVRSNAAEALGNLGHEAAIPGLIKALAVEDEKDSVLKTLDKALRKLSREKVILELRQLLQYPSWKIRWRATLVLGQLGCEEALPELREGLRNENFGIRETATRVLRQLCSRETIPELINTLRNDRAYCVRRGAAIALGQLGIEDAIPEMLKALRHYHLPDDCRTGTQTSVRLDSGEVIVSGINDEELANLGDDHAAFQWLLERNNLEIRIEVAEALGKQGNNRATRGLLQALTYSDSLTRWAAAIVLGQLGREEASSELLEALRYPHPDIRKKVIAALVSIGSEEVIQKLITTLEDPDNSVSQSAAEALGQIGSPTPLSDLWQMRLAGREELASTIEVIQERCKFYSYEIAVSPPSQEKSKAEPLTVPTDMQQYEEILSVLSNMVTVMERNPKTFEGIEEEALRDHFLVQLNGKYKGQATGETFNKKGKTDILIRVDGKNIFIAECKFWGGEKKLKETLDQLLGYTAWRDTKLALLLFNRNKNFSAVLEQISEVMKDHPTFAEELSYPSETGFRFILHHPEDKNRELVVTVLAFEIPR